MGGQTQQQDTNKQTQSTGSFDQTSQVNPYGPAAGGLFNLAQWASGQNPNLTGSESDVIGNLTGGGGVGQYGNWYTNAYGNLAGTLNPFTNPNNLNPMNTPGLGDSLAALKSDITGDITGRYAAAGRDLSGMENQTLARGLTQGLAPVIANQYNTNADRALNSANTLFGAGTTVGGSLANLKQMENQNALQGVQAGRMLPLQTASGLYSILGDLGQRFGQTRSYGTQAQTQNSQEQQTKSTPFNPWSLAPLALMPLTGGTSGLGSSLFGMGASKLFGSLFGGMGSGGMGLPNGGATGGYY